MFIDLTLPIDQNIPVFPGSPKPKITQVSTISKQGWNEKQILMTTHFSTHIDAPKHMREHGKTLSDYPIESYMGEAIVFDVKDQQHIDVDVSEVKEHDIVFFNTNHINTIHSSSFFENNPVLSEQMIRSLIKKKISILGIDSFTLDNEPYSNHKNLFDHDIRIVENVIHLDKIQQKRFFCYIFPLHIKDADGAPCRVVAQVK